MNKIQESVEENRERIEKLKEQTKLDFLLQKHFVEKKYESLKSLISEKTVTSNPNPFQISPSLQSVVYQPPPIPYQPAYQLNQPFSYIPPTTGIF